MDVADILAKALAAVEKANVPDDLRQAAFDSAVRLLSNGAPQAASASAPAPRAETPAPQEPTLAASSDPHAALATKAGVTAAAVREVFEVEGDVVHLVVPTKDLPSSKRTGQKRVALLIAGARQAIGLEERTSTKTIRAVCEDYSLLDHHFSEAIDEMSDIFTVRKENAKSKLLMLKRQGWEEFARVVQELSGHSKNV
jgi:hypothetical protein